MSAAIQFDTYGGPEVLHLADVAVPQPGPGQVRIRVRAAALNPLDIKIRSGQVKDVFPVTFPATPGFDVAGVVDAVGTDATAAIGDEVFGVARSGGYAEYALLDVAEAKPPQVSWSEAAAVPTAAETAYRVLALTGVKPGDTVLVHGASGSVGAMTAQLAVARGASVVGTASEANQEYLLGLGIHAAVYGDGWVERVRAQAPDGVDVVVDTAGRGVLAESVELTGDAHKVITIADNGSARYGVRFTSGGEGSDPERAYREVGLLLASGQVKVEVARELPLAEAGQAQELVADGNVRGKVILLP